MNDAPKNIKTPGMQSDKKKRMQTIIEETQKLAEKQGLTEDRNPISLQRTLGPREKVDEAVEKVLKLDKQHQERRAHRNIFKKSGNTLQKFSASFSKFLEAFAGIETIVRGVDPRIGSLVVGALSVVLMVSLLYYNTAWTHT